MFSSVFCLHGFVPGSVHMGFVWTKWQWDMFSSYFFGFPLSVSFHCGSVLNYHQGDEQLVATVQGQEHRIKFLSYLNQRKHLCTMLC
jgi:hypothetical protein